MRAARKFFPYVVIVLASRNVAAADLSVSATVIPACKLSVGITKAASGDRAGGGVGSFGVTCTYAAAITSGQDAGSRGTITSAMTHPQVRMTKGIVPHSKLEALATVADYRDMSVAEVLF